MSVGSAFLDAPNLLASPLKQSIPFVFRPGGCVRATLGLTAGYLIAPFCKIEPLTSQVYRLFKDDVPAPSSEQLRDTLNTVGLTLLVLLVVPRYTQGWDLQTDLQLVVPVMAGWVISDAVDSLAIAWYLQRR